MSAWNDPPKLRLINKDVSQISSPNPIIKEIYNGSDDSKPPIIIFQNKTENSTEITEEHNLFKLLNVSTFDESKASTETRYKDIIESSAQLVR